MKKYLHITMDTVENITKCFSDDEELVFFIDSINNLCNELSYTIESSKRTNNDALRGGLAIKQICVLALFFREYIEVMHEIVKAMNLEEVTEEEFKKLKDL